jgi:hypothetical protein
MKTNKIAKGKMGKTAEGRRREGGSHSPLQQERVRKRLMGKKFRCPMARKEWGII